MASKHYENIYAWRDNKILQRQIEEYWIISVVTMIDHFTADIMDKLWNKVMRPHIQIAVGGNKTYYFVYATKTREIVKTWMTWTLDS